MMHSNISGNIEGVLSRSEMKGIMAGAGNQVYIKCCNCLNGSCEGWVSDCDSGRYEICGPGPAGGDGPCATCSTIGND
jgi:hypothetical protein